MMAVDFFTFTFSFNYYYFISSSHKFSDYFSVILYSTGHVQFSIYIYYFGMTKFVYIMALMAADQLTVASRGIYYRKNTN